MSTDDIRERVAAITAEGEKTLVLHGPGVAAGTATRMLPALPEICFAESADLAEELREAVEHGVDQLILFATADALAASYGLGADGLLGRITLDMGGTRELAAEVAAAGSAGRACAMWEDAGLLGQCGRELCRRVAGELERAAAQAAAGTAAMGQAPAGTGAEGEAAAGTEAAGSPVAAQVVLVDASGERMIGMYGRLRG